MAAADARRAENETTADFIRGRKIFGESARGVAHLRQFVIDARAGIEHQSDAGRSGGSIERCNFLRGAVLEETKVVLRQSAHLRPVRRGDRASHLHQRDARTDGSRQRGGRILARECSSPEAGSRSRRRAVAQRLRARKFLGFRAEAACGDQRAAMRAACQRKAMSGEQGATGGSKLRNTRSQYARCDY